MFDRHIVEMHDLRTEKASIRRMMQSDLYKSKCRQASKHARTIEVGHTSHYKALVTAAQQFGVHIADVDYWQKKEVRGI